MTGDDSDADAVEAANGSRAENAAPESVNGAAKEAERAEREARNDEPGERAESSERVQSAERTGAGERPLLAGAVGLLAGIVGGAAATTIAPGNPLATILLIVVVVVGVTVGTLRALSR